MLNAEEDNEGNDIDDISSDEIDTNQDYKEILAKIMNQLYYKNERMSSKKHHNYSHNHNHKLPLMSEAELLDQYDEANDDLRTGGLGKVKYKGNSTAAPVQHHMSSIMLLLVSRLRL